jgi:hypothetical protein
LNNLIDFDIIDATTIALSVLGIIAGALNWNWVVNITGICILRTNPKDKGILQHYF